MFVLWLWPVACPEGWNSTDGYYAFKYQFRQSPQTTPVVLKMISMEQTLMVHCSLDAKGSPVHSTELLYLTLTDRHSHMAR